MQVICGILAVVVAVVFLGSVGFMIYHTVDNMINYKMEIGNAIKLAWDQYKSFVSGIFGGSKAEAGIFLGYDRGNHIPYVGCYTYN